AVGTSRCRARPSRSCPSPSETSPGRTRSRRSAAAACTVKSRPRRTSVDGIGVVAALLGLVLPLAQQRDQRLGARDHLAAPGTGIPVAAAGALIPPPYRVGRACTPGENRSPRAAGSS